jgi:oligoribonuclease (3'-5' exoribonuclease)
MRYVSIDIETTGCDPKRHQIIEFAAVIEDTEKDVLIEELPHFHKYVKHKDALWDTDTLLFHHKHNNLVRILNGGLEYEENSVDPYMLGPRFSDFLLLAGFDESKSITAAGKNFATFDLRFLEELPNWNECISIRDRVLDPAILFMQPTDEAPPNIKTCMKRANLHHEFQHKALDDAWDVISMIRVGKIKGGDKYE